MTRASQSRLSVKRTWYTWSLVFGFWFLILAPHALSQKIPVIGGYTWVFSGAGFDTTQRLSFRSLTHVPRLGQLIGATEYFKIGLGGYGAITALDEGTGSVIRIDSVCPRVGNHGIRSAWLNDSGTVMCYTCWGERPRLVEYPSMREIEDTILLKKDNNGGWFWAEGRVSSTGRYLILYQDDGSPLGNYYRLWLYDRVTSELVDLKRSSTVYEHDGETGEDRPQFDASDRLLVTRDSYMTGATVWDVEKRLEIGSKRNSGQRYLYMLSHTGDKLLITSSNRVSNVFVYDAWTLTQVWHRPIKDYDPPDIDHYGALSFDGSEVVLMQALETDTGIRLGSYWYALPDTTPRGYLAVSSYAAWLQPKSTHAGFLGGMYGGRPARYSWNTALSVTTTQPDLRQPLYPNPTTGEVVVNVGECQRESWQLRLSDQAGTLLREGTALCDDRKVRTAFHALPAGQYYLHLREPISGRSVQAIVSIQP